MDRNALDKVRGERPLSLCVISVAGAEALPLPAFVNPRDKFGKRGNIYLLGSQPPEADRNDC